MEEHPTYLDLVDPVFGAADAGETGFDRDLPAIPGLRIIQLDDYR